MKLLPLTQGKYALIDDDDYDWLMRWKWIYSVKSKDGQELVTAWIDGRSQHLSRVIMQPSNEMVVDHRNCNRLDNQRHNLRVCTERQNQAYKRVFKTSRPYRGVQMDKDRIHHRAPWRPRIKYMRQDIDLGRYETAEEAAYVYDQAAMQIHGEFARLNLLAD